MHEPFLITGGQAGPHISGLIPASSDMQDAYVALAPTVTHLGLKHLHHHSAHQTSTRLGMAQQNPHPNYCCLDPQP